MSKHTKGPWSVEEWEGKKGYTITSPAFDVVSRHLLIRREADAVLMAAAPEMLEMLKRTMELTESCAEQPYRCENSDIIHGLRLEIAELIKKVEGEA